MWVAAAEDVTACSAAETRARISRLPLRKPLSAKRLKPKYAGMKHASNATAPALRDRRGQPHAKHAPAAARSGISRPCSALPGHAQPAMGRDALFPILAASAKARAA